jgi:hypothetical protein
MTGCSPPTSARYQAENPNHQREYGLPQVMSKASNCKDKQEQSKLRAQYPPRVISKGLSSRKKKIKDAQASKQKEMRHTKDLSPWRHLRSLPAPPEPLHDSVPLSFPVTCNGHPE